MLKEPQIYEEFQSYSPGARPVTCRIISGSIPKAFIFRAFALLFSSRPSANPSMRPSCFAESSTSFWITDSAQVFIIGITLRGSHGIVSQFLHGRLTQSGSRGVGTDRTILQVIHPFLQGRDGHLIELIHTYKYIFREDLYRRQTGDNSVPLLGIYE